MNYLAWKPEGGSPIKAWVNGVPLDERAKGQLENLSKMPFIHDHVAAMPDVHWGMGATVGSVIATKGAIIPAAVGVDIGCGMMAVQTSIKSEHLPDNLDGLRSKIEATIPHGRSDNGGKKDIGGWSGFMPDFIVDIWKRELCDGWVAITDNHPKLKNANSINHLGTLGTGNHFIELCLDEKQRLWVMLHSGSRGIGNAIGRYFIEMAKNDMRKWFINVPDIDLAYFPEGTDHFREYDFALRWAQKFARVNREVMMQMVLDILRYTPGICEDVGMFVKETAVNCHHNYVNKENHYGSNVFITRKGAVRAREGDLGIIPGSMGARSYIVRGKGNTESFNSCSHGAGRVMSRGEAKKCISLEDHIKATEGVSCKKDESVIDESPAAYKDIDAVMEAQKDLVEIVHTLKQVVCIKG